MKANKLFILSIAALILTGCGKNKDNTSSGSGSSSEEEEQTTEDPHVDPEPEFVTKGKFLIGQTELEEDRTLSFEFEFVNKDDKNAKIEWGDGTSTQYTAADLDEGVIKASKTYTMPSGADANTKYDFKIIGEIDELCAGAAGSGFQYIESLDFGKSVKTLPADSFYNADRLVSVTGNEVEELGARSFSGANALASASFPKIAVIGIYAFYDTYLTSFTVASSIEFVSNGAFSNSMLESITFLAKEDEDPEYYISQDAFRECSELVSVTLADRLVGIGQQAFYDTPLTILEIPASCDTVIQYAFGNMGVDAKIFVNWPNYSKPSGWSANCAVGEDRNATLVTRVLDKVYEVDGVSYGTMGVECEDWTGPSIFIIDASEHKGERLTFNYIGPVYTEVVEARFINYNETISLDMNTSPKQIKVDINPQAPDNECMFYFLFDTTTPQDYAVSIAYSNV